MGILRLEKPDSEDAQRPGGQEAEEAQALMRTEGGEQCPGGKVGSCR